MLQVYILNGGKLWNTVLCNWIEEKANNRKTYMKNKTKIIYPACQSSIHRVGRLTAKSREVLKSRFGCYNGRVAMKCHRNNGSASVEVSVKFESDWKSLNPNLASTLLYEFLRQGLFPLNA